MAYTKQTWADLPSKTTPINATRLGHIEDGIFNAAQTADTAASTAGTAAANVGIVSGKVTTLEGQMYDVLDDLDDKVDKVTGKGLSTNDYDNTDKGKVDSLGTASTKNSTSVVTDSSDLVESGAVKDIIGWGNKNLFNKNAVENGIIDESGAVAIVGNWKSSEFIKVTPSEKYIISGVNSSYASSAGFAFYNSGKTFVSGGGINVFKNTPITIPDNVEYIRFSVVPADLDTVQLEKGTTATSYESYHASVEETIPQEISEAVGWDVGNLIPMTITAMKAVNTLGTWNGNIYTFNGVTFEPHVLNNGVVDSIKINGTPSQWTQLYLSNAITLPVGNYALSSKNNIPNNVYLTYASFGQSSALSQNQNLKYVSITTPASNTPYVGLEGVTVTNLVVYPVIRNLNVNERKADNSVIAPVENGTTASQAYAVGSHAIRNGAFITWKNAKAQGETINDASDYTSGDVADSITNLESGKAYSYRYGYSSSADQTKTLNISADGKHSALIIASHSGGSEIAVFLATGNTAQPFTIKSDSNFIATTSNSRIVITSAFTNWILTIFSAGNVSVS